MNRRIAGMVGGRMSVYVAISEKSVSWMMKLGIRRERETISSVIAFVDQA